MPAPLKYYVVLSLGIAPATFDTVREPLLHPRTGCKSRTKEPTATIEDPREAREKRRLKSFAENGCDLLPHKQRIKISTILRSFYLGIWATCGSQSHIWR
ncbi:hypothetical protein TNCV_549461 [Trichonephila clavipes]|nr:hypothetical protein TNCV_549461 [Trichonephila clavipes]